MPNVSLLETFPTPPSDLGLPFIIEHIAEEFTSVCPKTGHPDFGTVTLRYSPRAASDKASRGCVELKSLKLYYHSFRSEGIFYEAVTNRIRDDLVKLLNPMWLVIVTDWRGRGGIRSRITAEFGEAAR